MSVQVRLPSSLRGRAGGAATVDVAATDVERAIHELIEKFPGLRPHLFDDQDRIRAFVNVFVNGDNARDLDGPSTTLSPGDELSIVPSMAGG